MKGGSDLKRSGYREKGYRGKGGGKQQAMPQSRPYESSPKE